MAALKSIVIKDRLTIENRNIQSQRVWELDCSEPGPWTQLMYLGVRIQYWE